MFVRHTYVTRPLIVANRPSDLFTFEPRENVPNALTTLDNAVFEMNTFYLIRLFVTIELLVCNIYGLVHS